MGFSLSYTANVVNGHVPITLRIDVSLLCYSCDR